MRGALFVMMMLVTALVSVASSPLPYEIIDSNKSVCSVVSAWSKDTFSKVINDLNGKLPAPIPQSLVDEWQTSQNFLTDVWSGQKAGDDANEKTLGKISQSLSALSSTFLDGATTLANGVRMKDVEAITEGVLGMLSGIFTAVGAFDPVMAVVGSVISLCQSLLKFIFAIFFPPPAQGTTSITVIMERVIKDALEQFRLQELNDEFAANLNNAKSVYFGFDNVNASTVDEAISLIHEMDLPAIDTKMTGFIGTLQNELNMITASRQPDRSRLTMLLGMYWHTTMHSNLIQQRALTALSMSCKDCTSTNASANLPIAGQVYASQLLYSRGCTKTDFGSWRGPLSGYADYLWVGQPGAPQTRLHLLQYDFAIGMDAAGQSTPIQTNLSVGKTSSSGYGVMRTTPAGLEIQYQDDSTWHTSHVIYEGDWVGIINNETDYEKDKTLLTFYDSRYPEYCGGSNECYGGGTKDKIDEALMRFHRVGYDINGTLAPKQQGPIRSGDVVEVFNKYWVSGASATQLCGGDEVNKPYASGDGSYYLFDVYNTSGCPLSRWRVEAVGNEDVGFWAGLVDSMYQKLNQTGNSPTPPAPLPGPVCVPGPSGCTVCAKCCKPYLKDPTSCAGCVQSECH